MAFWTRPLSGQWLTQLIFYKSGSVFSKDGFALRLDGTRMSLSLGGRELLSSEIAVDQASWCFVAFSWDGRDWRLYQNAQLGAESREHPPYIFPGKGVPMNIGGINVHMNTVYQGMIDEFRIWDRVLPQESIMQVMMNDLEKVAAHND